MSRFSALMRTTAVRLSTLYLLLFIVGAVALVFYMTNLSASMLAAQTQQSLGEEIGSIGKSYARGGIPQLVRTIDYRSRQPGAYLYLVADPTGRILAGNVESVEPGVLDTDGIIERGFNYRRYGEQGTGRDLGEPERFRNVVRQSLMLALGIMGIGALLIWLFVGRRALKRIDEVSKASQRIMDGDLTGRLPVNGSGDEFDRLSGNLNVMLGKILELNEGLKQVSDNIAHDLKTPLTRLRNRAEEALSGKKAGPEYREALEDIIGESDQLIRTFNAILMISRLEAGYSSENLENMPVAPILRDVAEMYEPVAEDAGVSLTLGDLDEVALHINRELVGQTISNLVDNAIKYAGGDERTATVSLSMERDPNWVRIIVADNGPGIPEEKREQATERFVRLEESRTQPGSGLGLSLAKAVMKLHGGALRLEGNDPGLRAVLEFPLPSDKVE